MRLNSSTQLISEQVILVPYRIEHVPKYHEWMQNADLREKTASEKLTLEQEYAMQQTWLNDDDKCTFIALDKATMLKTNNEIESMIGDANIYLSRDDNGQLVGEIGLMVAEFRIRGRGLGKEIALCLIRYGIEDIKIKRFQAVISLKNEISVTMFERLGFTKESSSDVFQEVTLTRRVDEEFVKFIQNRTQHYLKAETAPNK